MTHPPTPGEVAYTAWQAAMWARWPQLALAPWPIMPWEEQAPWEAAAQAVMATPLPGDTTCPACGARDTVCVDHVVREDLQAGTLQRPMACACCAATWDNVYVLAQTASLHLRSQEDSHA